MKIYEIGTGYTPIPAQMGAATEIVVEGLTRAFQKLNQPAEILDIRAANRAETDLPIREVAVAQCFCTADVKLGWMHKLKRVVYSLSLTATLQRILKAAQEQVVLHFHNQYNLFFFLKLTPAKLRAKARIAYTVHSYIWAGQWGEIEKTVRTRYFQERYCVQHADDVLVLNERTAAHFVQRLGVAPERIHRVTNGVDTDTYRILEDEKIEAFRRSEGLDDQKLIFQAGSVCDRKNQLGAVKMLTAYLQNHPDVIYLYAGGIIDEAYQQEIAAHAARHGIAAQVRYGGELCPGELLNLYYNAATVTVFPSKIESFGLVIIESLCAGTPVLLAQKPLFELQRGYYTYRTAEEFVQLADALIRGGSDKETLRKEAAQTYDWQRAAQEHLRIWEGGTHHD